MAVITHLVLSRVTTEQYDAVRAACGWLNDHPTGGIAYLTWWEGADNHNVDAWESEEAFTAFGTDRLGPAMAKVIVNVELQVTLHPAHETFLPSAATLTSA
ncbi:MAG: hypothetical protein ABI894_17585 [Ilumatobacteraceae bacterium]